MGPLRLLFYALAAIVGVVLFVTLGLVLFLFAAVAVVCLAAVGAVRLWFLRRRLAKQGIELFPVGRSRRTGRSREPDVIDVVPERE